MKPYDATFRRTLLDMHIPDWDPAFLSKYDPVELAALYARAGIEGALIYCKSHLGLNYWPAPVGGIHPAAQERDLVLELSSQLRHHGIAPAAYHSVIFDNWAVENNPGWAIRPATTLDGSDVHLFGPRYGTACANNLDYRAYEHTQIAELLRRYDFDALWIDMAFWSAVCICDICQDRLAVETGLELPTHANWASPQWTEFQACRERWLEEFYRSIVEVARGVRPGLPVTHNLSPGLNGWFRGQMASHSRHDTFPAGDFYGGPAEQAVVSKLMVHLGDERRPAEFMTSRTTNLRGHVELKSEREMLVQALATTASSQAFLFIDAIDPIGTVNEAVYDRIANVFRTTAPFEPFLGGRPIEDIALYYSDESRIDPLDNDKSLAELEDADVHSLPHLRALTGTAKALLRAHLPFGVITRNSLQSLRDYRAVVLPDVLRMAREETEAFRDYVAAGGRLYASGRTGLLDTDGTGHSDFPLADVFGCHVGGVEDGGGVFVKPVDARLAAAVAPEEYLAFGFDSIAADAIVVSLPPLGTPRLDTQSSAKPLATLTLPFGYPSAGSAVGRDFSSIHSSPPWEDLTVPAIVSNDFGDGRAVYSSAPIEAGTSAQSAKTFISLIRDLLDDRPTLEATAHPDVWVFGFDQPESNRTQLSILRYDIEELAGTTPVLVRYRGPSDRRVSSVRRALTGETVGYTRRPSDVLEVSLDLNLFEMLLVEYETDE